MMRMLAASLALVLTLGSAAGAEIPRKAPAATFAMADGQSLDLAEFGGKVIALEFLKTTCPTCKQMAGIMQKLQAEHGADGFQALGVAVDDDASSKVGAYASTQGLNFPVGYVPLEDAYRFLQHSVMKLMHMPQLVFIDKTGTIRAQYAGTDEFLGRGVMEANIRALVQKLLAE